ncbi:uncharacterized protein LOC135117658 [Helicoverpa armigera]|uniref:uncharacterized protein LOC135117658 n=1 Tax=Helicoverpa armigera TaxID=29058 RepID=UPI003083389F
MCTIEPIVRPITVPFKRRFNYGKANWEQYSESIDTALFNLPPMPQNYDRFVDIVTTTARKYIPRGCRTSYIPGLSKESTELLKRYEQSFDRDPFSEDTLELGENLLLEISEARHDKWMETVTNINMTHNSKKAWTTIRKLTNEAPPAVSPSKVTANQVAHQLIVNGKPEHRLGRVPKVRYPENTSDSTICQPFNLADITSGIRELKRFKASGMDNISVEQIQHLGPVAVSWLLELFNNCMTSVGIPRLWRKAKTIAILKPGKPADDPKSFRPISLLCHTFKLFERLILNRLASLVDPKLIPEQAGFRPGKSCCSQTLNLTQHIEDGFETGKVTGTVFVDLSAAYDTVNIKRLLWKVGELTGDRKFVGVLGELLQNRRFQVHLSSDKKVVGEPKRMAYPKAAS